MCIWKGRGEREPTNERVTASQRKNLDNDSSAIIIIIASHRTFCCSHFYLHLLLLLFSLSSNDGELKATARTQHGSRRRHFSMAYLNHRSLPSVVGRPTSFVHKDIKISRRCLQQLRITATGGVAAAECLGKGVKREKQREEEKQQPDLWRREQQQHVVVLHTWCVLRTTENTAAPVIGFAAHTYRIELSLAAYTSLPSSTRNDHDPENNFLIFSISGERQRI